MLLAQINYFYTFLPCLMKNIDKQVKHTTQNKCICSDVKHKPSSKIWSTERLVVPKGRPQTVGQTLICHREETEQKLSPVGLFFLWLIFHCQLFSHQTSSYLSFIVSPADSTSLLNVLCCKSECLIYRLK